MGLSILEIKSEKLQKKTVFNWVKENILVKPKPSVNSLRFGRRTYQETVIEGHNIAATEQEQRRIIIFFTRVQ